MRQVPTQVKSDLIFNERLTDFSVDIYNYHGIYNLQGNRVNPDKNIVIGKHVWICLGAKILKGTEIADGCVVGGGAVLSGTYPLPNSILVGNPAKVVREHICWNEQRKDYWEVPDALKK